MGVQKLAWVCLVVVGAVGVTARSPHRGVNEIQEYVKRLEYEVRQGGATYQVEGGAQVDLNLLPDDVILRQVEEGLDEEFALVDEANGDKEEKNKTDRGAERQRSLMYQGVYVPDARFNAFVDGVMVNMVVEMKRKDMDPLFFRVYSRGIVEHVPVRGSSTSSSTSTTTPASSTFESSSSSSSSSNNNNKNKRKGRNRGSAIGGGVIRGLTNIKRFGNAEVQIAGNTTLVRSHHVFGPINLELLFTTERGVRGVNTTLDALAAHALAHATNTTTTSDNSFVELFIDRPAAYEIHLEGTKSERYKRLSLSAINRLFKPTGRLERRLRSAFRRARRGRIPDVTKRGARRNGGRRRGGGNERKKEENGNGNEPELP